MARDVAWYQKLGCDQDPFSPNPAVDSFYFETQALASHLNTLTSVASKGEFIGLVKGDRGIGKTTLLNQMARRFRDNPDVAFTRVTCTDGCSLIQSLGISSGLTEEELAVEPRKVLIEHLTRLRTGGQKVVAAIDDAHLLSPQDLAMLIRIGLSPNASGLVHTILFAEADIEARLWLSAINDPLPLDRLYTLILTPLGADQTPAYLAHRLGAAGLEKVSFSAAEAAAIHRRSEGLPAAVNEQAGLRLERRYGPVWSRGLGAVQRFRPAWAAGLAGVAVAAGLVVWQREPLTEWATSLNLELPFIGDTTGTEVAIAIPDQSGDKPPEAPPKAAESDGVSPVAPIPGLDNESETAVVTAYPVPEGDSDGAAADLDGIIEIADSAEEVTVASETGEASPDAATGTAAEVVALVTEPVETTPATDATTASDIGTLLDSGPPPVPQRLQERLAAREREQAETGDRTVLAEETSTDPAADSPETAPPALHRPADLAEFPRLAGLGEPQLPDGLTADAPLTPETPTTPITGRPRTSKETAPGVVRPRPRPAPPPVAGEAQTATPATEEAVASVEPAGTSTDTQAAAEPTPPAPTRQVPRPRPKPEVPSAPQVATVAPPPTEAAPRPEPTVPAPAAETTSVRSVPLAEVRREDWFRQQPPGNYVIQLLVASEEDKLQSYIANQRFPAPPAYYRRGDRGTYVLVLGPYPDQREARRAINRLPGSLRRNQPWVRSMASVQQELP